MDVTIDLTLCNISKVKNITFVSKKLSEIDLNVDFMQKGLRKLNYKVGRHEAKRIWLLSPSGKNRKPSS